MVPRSRAMPSSWVGMSTAALAAREHLGLDFGLDDRTEALPRPGEVADHHDPFGGDPATIMRMPRPRWWAIRSSAFSAWDRRGRRG